ncbi:MAG: hypothetical protein SW019_11000 [Actinomycetota bacterium]|nr:hypothetical protein [Actinomycetota bacterium]
MESTELFSHPARPEHVASRNSQEPVQAPVFSDQPGASSSVDQPPA